MLSLALVTSIAFLFFVACTDDESRAQPAPTSTDRQNAETAEAGGSQAKPSPLPLTIAALEGQSLESMMRAIYVRQQAKVPSVCSYVLGAGIYGLPQILEPEAFPPESVAELVTGWTGSIWIGEFSDYELAWTEPKRIVLVSVEGVPPPHQGFYETVSNGLEFARIRGEWELTTISRLFDCEDTSVPLPDGIGTLASRHRGEEGYFLYDVEEAVDYDHESQDETEQRYSILEIRNPQDWPPAIDVAELADLLTATARERWSVDFACVSVTRRSVESGDAGTGLNADSPMPDGILSIFEELRYDPEQALLRLIGERSIVLAWVETRGGAGQVNGGEFVRDSSGEWAERTWVSMYGCDALGQ